jgi:hypothetical protein
MAEQVIPVKRTAVTMPDYVRAVVRGWPRVGGGIPEEKSIAVLWAQYMIETGGRSCWNFNMGNVKHVKGDGHDYQMLAGVWEGVTQAAAQQLIAGGQATLDSNADHIKAVGPNRVSVVFQPPHPATWFRAFKTLDDGMAEHLQFLAKRFSKAWPAVLEGDYLGFANLLKAMGYFTASAQAYAAGMKAPYNALIASTTYEELVATPTDPIETEAVDVDSADAILWDRDIELEKFISVMHEDARDLLIEDLLADRKRRLLDES